MSSSFTCISCRVQFQSGDEHRCHYKSDWHRYNLKRKAAGMPPVTAENFEQRILAQSLHQSDAPAKGDSHIKQSKKERKQKPKDRPRPPEDSNSEISTDSDCEPEPLELTECLFCPHHSADMDAKLGHMAKSHGFFIPDVEYVCNLKGLVGYLDWKVGVANACLHCIRGDGKGPRQFSCVEAAQNHMRDKSHCMMRYDETCAEQYADFYDFSSAYPNDVTPGNDSEKLSEMAVCELTGELVLPSGARAGHRSLQRYFKQSLPPERPHGRQRQLDKVMAHYRMLGWHGDDTVKRKEFRRGQFEKQKKLLKGRLRLGVKANKMQKHFRIQIMF